MEFGSSAGNHTSQQLVQEAAAHSSHYYRNEIVDFRDEDVGWFCYKDQCRLLQPFQKLSFATLGRRGMESPLSIGLIPLAEYFFIVSVFTIFDLYGEHWNWITKYKLQSHKRVSLRVIYKAVKLTMKNTLMIVAPAAMMQYVTNNPEWHAQPMAPTIFEFFFENFLMLVLFDFLYYTWHYCHHKNRRLYKWCHIVHHEFHSTSAWSSQYAHPWELLCTGMYLGSLQLMFDSHWLTTLGFSSLITVENILAHCGYDLPIDLSNLFPFLFGGGRKHDMHHMKPFTNFQPFLSTWDKLTGDECPGLLPGNKKPKELLEWEEKREKKALEWYCEMPKISIESDNED